MKAMGDRSHNFDDPKLAAKLGWKVWRRAVAGVVLNGSAVSVIAIASAPVFLVNHDRHADLPWIAFVVVASGIAVASLLGVFVTRAKADHAMGWIAAGRAPSRAEVSRVAALPRFAAWWVAGNWVVVVPVLLFWVGRWVGGIKWNDQGWEAAVLIYGMGALSTGFTVYLFTEQAVRPVLSRVLPPETDEWPRTLGVTTRLLLTALVIAVAPLLVIGLVVVVVPTTHLRAFGPAIAAGCFQFAFLGSVVFVIAGRAITSPLERLRAALRRVTEGDLDVEVEAVEGGEIGLLQVGFNEMVAGLRERERLRDVFGRHVGADVARRAMEHDFAHGGELCDATAMFVDIIGSTALAERESPDAVVAILNSFFDVVVRVVGDEGGSVNKFQGDGALCLFGTLDPLPDHAACALRAARRLRIELGSIDGIQAAIGVASGQVVAGDVGTADRYEFTAIGDAVNEASRLCDAAKGSDLHVLASAQTLRHADDESALWERGATISLRGRSTPTETYSPGR